MSNRCASGKILITDAVDLDNIELVKKAVAQDEKSIDAKDKNGFTPLMSAVINGNVDLVKFLESNGCSATLNQ
ncbi:ankyrin repeat domain-containing protein [Leptospira mtsangambouensis]|uniref:Ankyrin repeat domain-containing protein n=1 Tax=Leptospira mtsangambouensis TaxID=2484912 RepID=A0ABY2P278_9LEPT|nr:ankyrin repeat domain-containing protein [Leptospira mtsangambouensis]